MSNEAFGNRSSSGTWCRIGNGKIIRQAQPGDPGAVKVPRLDAKGAPVMDEHGQPQYYHQIQNDTVTGRIVGLATKTDMFGDVEIRKLVVTLHHPSAGNIHVQIKEGSRYWTAFLQALPNVDLSKDVTLIPWDYESKADGKRKIGLGIQQDGSPDNIKWAFERGTIPAAVEHKINGRSVWDFGPVNQFLIENSLAPTAEKLTAATPPAEQRHAEAAPDAGAAPQHIGFDDEGGDLPF